uniref:Ubiquitin-protein ligase, putative n=1 Tax=Arundo donax TaxID=35708 RepID=A0A0A9HRJ9_ARUDO
MQQTQDLVWEERFLANMLVIFCGRQMIHHPVHRLLVISVHVFLTLFIWKFFWWHSI